MYVIKATGVKEIFSEDKLRNSVKRAGIPLDLQEQVISHVKSKLYDNIPTAQVYHHILEFLDTTQIPYSKSRYSLKHAIMRLGPTGYPFEDFLTEIVKVLGYQATVRNHVRGRCITHEVDVIATKGDEKAMIEAKYHNLPGNTTNVHVALYTKARFEDVKDINQLTHAWIVTNTHITQDALVFAKCANIRVISWAYPEGESLRDIIEKNKIHPITQLSSLSFSQMQQLLTHHTVLCKDIAANPSVLDILQLPKQQKDDVLQEAGYITHLL